MNPAIKRVAATMRDFPGPWGIAGGWGLDLFLNRQSREHADIDVALLRSDQAHLRARLDGRVMKVASGRLVDWLPSEQLALPVHEVHVEWPDGFEAEFLLNEHGDTTHEWIFRRDTRVRRSLAAAFHTGTVAPYLAPEIILLYKAKSPGPKDNADFVTVLPQLTREQRSWLSDAVALTVPGHPWLTALSASATFANYSV